MLAKLLEIEEKFEAIEASLADPEVASQPRELMRLGKARAEIEDLVTVIREYRQVLQGLDDAKEMIEDPEMKQLALEELDLLRARREELEETLKVMLLPSDPNDGKSVIVEIRPAAGGDEAGIFAYELYRMYARYAERMKWPVSLLEMADTGVGGASRVVFQIDQAGAFSQLKHESGVHRVQRVPATESQGRIHTSTVTVAVMPEADEVDIQINDKDLEITSFRSSSAGGQHMQKNDTAVRIVHKPSGIVSTCQDERSQAQNKEKAMAVLRAKLYEIEQDRIAQEQGELRRSHVGSGDRSEKIRTYNFPQDRLTDHRIGLTLHSLPLIMDGDLQKLIDALVQHEQASKMAKAQETAAGS